MNALMCQKCGATNAATENFCLNCGAQLFSAPSNFGTGNVGASLQNYQSQGFNLNPTDSFYGVQRVEKIGGATFLWYRVFTFLIGLGSLLLISGLGLMAILGSNASNVADPAGARSGGTILIIIGVVIFAFYAAPMILPRKMFHWVYGIILLLLSLSLCWTLPFAVPLLIYWFKPETKRFFGA